MELQSIIRVYQIVFNMLLVVAKKYILIIAQIVCENLLIFFEKLKEYLPLNIHMNINNNAFDHWSEDTKQDAWFTASSLHGVIETLDKKPKCVTIISDNSGHYHNTELMIILSYWKEWYDIYVSKWIFLEAGEAKTIIDSHHAQVRILFYLLLCHNKFIIKIYLLKITHAVKRYVKLGYKIVSGNW